MIHDVFVGACLMGSCLKNRIYIFSLWSGTISSSEMDFSESIGTGHHKATYNRECGSPASILNKLLMSGACLNPH